MNEPVSAIRVLINGETHEVPRDQSLFGVISGLGLPPQAALVEHNGQALLRSEWDDRPLADGDQLEILRVVAGG